MPWWELPSQRTLCQLSLERASSSAVSTPPSLPAMSSGPVPDSSANEFISLEGRFIECFRARNDLERGPVSRAGAGVGVGVRPGVGGRQGRGWQGNRVRVQEAGLS